MKQYKKDLFLEKLDTPNKPSSHLLKEKYERKTLKY